MIYRKFLQLLYRSARGTVWSGSLISIQDGRWARHFGACMNESHPDFWWVTICKRSSVWKSKRPLLIWLKQLYIDFERFYQIWVGESSMWAWRFGEEAEQKLAWFGKDCGRWQNSDLGQIGQQDKAILFNLQIDISLSCCVKIFVTTCSKYVFIFSELIKAVLCINTKMVTAVNIQTWWMADSSA